MDQSIFAYVDSKKQVLLGALLGQYHKALLSIMCFWRLWTTWKELMNDWLIDWDNGQLFLKQWQKDWHFSGKSGMTSGSLPLHSVLLGGQ
jgi:hypothetical protein